MLATQGQQVLTIEERVQSHLEDGTHSLYVCPNVWAMSHRMVGHRTGKAVRVRCGSWSCPYCGSHKVEEWRRCIEEAGPTLHLVLTKAGHTVEEAARAMTTFMQALRRGSKGKGKGRVGVRPAFPVEYFAVMERHEDFEENGFHWHILLKGVEFLPHDILSGLWRSATGGRAYIVYIRRVENRKAIGYVTKYLTKDITRGERGSKAVGRAVTVLRSDEEGHPVLDERGHLVFDRKVVVDAVRSRARRIRYSRHFFPMQVQALRSSLFSPQQRQEEEGSGPLAVETVQAMVEQEQWTLKRVAPVVKGSGHYQKLLRHTLTETMTERVQQGRRLSRRVLTVWKYQNDQHLGKSFEYTEAQRERWAGKLVSVDLPKRHREKRDGKWQWSESHEEEQVYAQVVEVSPGGEVLLEQMSAEVVSRTPDGEVLREWSGVAPGGAPLRYMVSMYPDLFKQLVDIRSVIA